MTNYNVRMNVDTNISMNDDDIFPTMELAQAWIDRKTNDAKNNPDMYGDLNNVYFTIEVMEDGKLRNVINL